MSIQQGKTEGCHPPTGNRAACRARIAADESRLRLEEVLDLLIHFFASSDPCYSVITVAGQFLHFGPSIYHHARCLPYISSPVYGRKGFVTLLYPNHTRLYSYLCTFPMCVAEFNSSCPMCFSRCYASLDAFTVMLSGGLRGT